MLTRGGGNPFQGFEISIIAKVLFMLSKIISLTLPQLGIKRAYKEFDKSPLKIKNVDLLAKDYHSS